jgi:hypothetical protein
MLNIKLKCQKEEFYTHFLNVCRNNLQMDILIIPAGISSPSSATMIIIVKNMGRNDSINRYLLRQSHSTCGPV